MSVARCFLDTARSARSGFCLIFGWYRPISKTVQKCLPLDDEMHEAGTLFLRFADTLKERLNKSHQIDDTSPSR